MILSQISAYQRENGTTVLLVSHSMEDVARTARKVLVMNKGQVAMYAGTDEVFSRAEELTAIGLSVPAVTRIFQMLKQQGLVGGDGVYTVEQAKHILLPLLRKGEPDHAQ